MLKQYIENKMYVGMLFQECPLNQENILDIRDRYYVETPKGLYIFFDESELKNGVAGLEIVSYEENDIKEGSGYCDVLCPA